MKKILFIDNNQFGYLIDTYSYCLYLKDKYNITYLCFKKKEKCIDLDNINIIYVSYKGNKVVRGCRFFLYAIFNMIFFKGFIFVVYFPGFEILKKILPWKKMHLDIRTLSVNKDKKERIKHDNRLRYAVKIYDSVSAISRGVISELGCSKKIDLLPLGADIISSSNKSFDSIRLLYIGTLNGRDIIKTVIGFESFIKKHMDLDVHYDIVGYGKKEYDEIKNYIDFHHLNNYITLHGYVLHNQLYPFFENNNIGVSFIPMTEYYDLQPPTKTFEYILSGLYTIATRTQANQEVINENNGCIINDTPEDFTEALNQIIERKKKLNSEIIRNSLTNYSWKNIIKNYLIPIINK